MGCSASTAWPITGKAGCKDMFYGEQEIERLITWIRTWFEENGPTAKAVVGISGGKDSGVCAALLVRALGVNRVQAVMMPDGVQADIADSWRLVDYLGLTPLVINIGPATAAMKSVLSEHLVLSEDARINLPARIRMTTLYAVAQSVEGGGRVCNTCNLSEDYIGYSTKYGDAAGDFSLLADFTVTEVLALGDGLGLPKELVHKAPSDGLCRKTDEEKIGFSYATLDRYIREGICEEEAIKAKIDKMHQQNLHKLKPIPAYCHEI